MRTRPTTIALAVVLGLVLTASSCDPGPVAGDSTPTTATFTTGTTNPPSTEPSTPPETGGSAVPGTIDPPAPCPQEDAVGLDTRGETWVCGVNGHWQPL